MSIFFYSPWDMYNLTCKISPGGYIYESNTHRVTRSHAYTPHVHQIFRQASRLEAMVENIIG